MKRTMKPVHPGAILRDDILKEMNLSITKAAEGIHVSRKQLSEVVNETSSITAEMALRLQSAFGVDATFWLDLQRNFDLWKVQESGKVKDIQVFKTAS